MALSSVLVLIVVPLLAALIQGIGSATALVSAAIEAHKEKMPSF